MKRMILTAALLIGMAPTGFAQSEDITGVISSQLEAFKVDDFERAFTFASPMIKQMFDNPDRFGQMVRNGYPMVWRPADVRFGGLDVEDGRTTQTVYFLDQFGRQFEAEYEMLETEAGWKINGVRLREMSIGS